MSETIVKKLLDELKSTPGCGACNAHKDLLAAVSKVIEAEDYMSRGGNSLTEHKLLWAEAIQMSREAIAKMTPEKKPPTAREIIKYLRNDATGDDWERLLIARVEAVLALKHPLTRSADFDEGWFACIKEVHRILDGGKP